MERRLRARETGRDNRRVQPTRHAQYDTLEALRPGADRMTSDRSERVNRDILCLELLLLGGECPR